MNSAILVVLLQLASDPAAIARGEKIFAQSCSVGYCHGVAGAAARGPRLRGREFAPGYVYQVTRDGIPRSAMPAWKDKLPDGDIHAVAAYVMSLGTEAGEAAPAPSHAPAAASPTIVGRGAFLERCGICHKGEGNGVGLLGRQTAASLEEAFGRPAKAVVRLTLSGGESFPAFVSSEEKGWVVAYDLSVTPPVRRTLAASSLQSRKAEPGWRHPKVAAGELTEITQYLGR